MSDTLSRALDEPEQHLQTIRIASPLGSFWLRSALGTYRPTAARAMQNGASYEHRGRAQMAVMAASDAIPEGGFPCRTVGYFFLFDPKAWTLTCPSLRVLPSTVQSR